MENVAEELQIHFVYAGYPYFYLHEKLRSNILNGMKKYKIKSVMVTSIDLERLELITKERMESYCKGETYLKDSVNDDLESLFENIGLGKKPNEEVKTYFLPKLTEEELELVERRDTSYLQTFSWEDDADVDETEMMLSESDSKYVDVLCTRKTYVIENSSKTSSEDSSEDSSETSSETSSEIPSEDSTENSIENLSENSTENSIENIYENWPEKQSCLKNCCNCSLQ